VIKGQQAVLTDKQSGYQEHGTYIDKTDEHYVIENQPGLVALYKVNFWECEEVRDEKA